MSSVSHLTNLLLGYDISIHLSLSLHLDNGSYEYKWQTTGFYGDRSLVNESIKVIGKGKGRNKCVLI